MSDSADAIAPDKPPDPPVVKAGCAVASLGSVHTQGLADYLDKLEARIRVLEQSQQTTTP